MQEIQNAIKNFLEELEVLVEDYGETEVARALEQVMPGFRFLDNPLSSRIDQAQERHVSTGDHQEEESELFFEASRLRRGKRLLNKARDFITDKLGKSSPKAGKIGGGAAVGGAAGAAGSKVAGGAALGLGTWTGKIWDQDISIDDITTDKALNVKSDDLEDLLMKTYQSIEKMTQVITQTQQDLSKKLGDLDKSVDYLSTDEDDTPESVDVRQDLGLARKKTKTASKKEKEKEQKAKDLEKSRKQAPVATEV